jgi:hypothetical protein
VPIAATATRAVDLLDGRVEVHGHVETQMRALSEKFSEEVDLAQWYNILDLELDAHVLPDGWGPIDVMSAHVRAEGRYDAIYSRGFGLFPSIDTYGNHARRLPRRLRDAEDPDYAGVTPGPEGEARRIPNERPAPFAPIGERRGIPDYDLFFRQAGGDNQIGTADDPARYANARILDYRYALVETRGPAGGPGQTQVLGPWLPKNVIVAEALGIDRANPLRGRIPATAIPSAWNGTSGGAYDDPRSCALLHGRSAAGRLHAHPARGLLDRRARPDQRHHGGTVCARQRDQRGVARKVRARRRDELRGRRDVPESRRRGHLHRARVSTTSRPRRSRARPTSRSA